LDSVHNGFKVFEGEIRIFAVASLGSMCLDLSLFLAFSSPTCLHVRESFSFILFSQRQVTAAEAQSGHSVFLSSLALTSNLIKPLVSESQRSPSQLFCPFFSDTLLLPCTQCEEHFFYFSCSQTSHAHFTAGLTLLHGVVSPGLLPHSSYRRPCLHT